MHYCIPRAVLCDRALHGTARRDGDAAHTQCRCGGGGSAKAHGCRILFIITDDDPRPGPVAISPAIIAILFIVIAFITLLVTDFTVCRF